MLISEQIKTINNMITGNDVRNHTGDISDGYHTFGELYDHRRILFGVICNSHKDKCFKSKLHFYPDDEMFEGYFIVGITTPEGLFTYHYELKYWDEFDVEELERGLKPDGHTSKDVTRLLSL